MERCIDELIVSSGLSKEYKKSPAGNNLFVVGDGAELDVDKMKIFHSLVVKTTYISKRARPNILVAGNFLTRRIRYNLLQLTGRS